MLERFGTIFEVIFVYERAFEGFSYGLCKCALSSAWMAFHGQNYWSFHKFSDVHLIEDQINFRSDD